MDNKSLKLLIIENFINWLNDNELDREKRMELMLLAHEYVEDSLVNEIDDNTNE